MITLNRLKLGPKKLFWHTLLNIDQSCHVLPHFRNKFPCLYPRRPDPDGGQELGGALIKSDKLMKRKLLTNTRSSSSSFTEKPGIRNSQSVDHSKTIVRFPGQIPHLCLLY